MNVLEVKHIKKSFGAQTVLDDITFSVPQGSIYGFIGRNGAGKTTMMNIALGLLKADGGEVLIQGQQVQYGETKTNQLVGYLPDVPEFYPFLTAREFLKLCADISEIEGQEADKKITDLLDMVGLEDTKKRINTYSRGMKQRLGIAQALINDPVLLICDEPTSALDPVGRKQLLNVLKKVKGKTSVIFSTHILSDVESICDEVAILNDGKIVAEGSLTELKKKLSNEKWSITLETVVDAERLQEKLAAFPILSNVVQSERTVEGAAEHMKEGMPVIFQTLSEHAITPLKVERREGSMEEVFLEAIK